MYDPTTYNYQNPTFVKDNYTPNQKTAQTNAGTKMMQALVAAAQSGASSYTIPPGTYRVPVATYSLNNISNFTINLPKVNIWLIYQSPSSYPAGANLSWLNCNYCTNINILGDPKTTNFDSEQLQFIQGTVTAWNASAGTIDIQIMSGYDAAGFTAQQGEYSWLYSQQGDCVTRPSYTSFTNLSQTDPTQIRLTVGTTFFTDGEGATLQVGQIFLTRHNYNYASGGWNCVVSCGRSNTNFEIDGINSWHGPMWECDSPCGTFVTKNCSNYRRPGTNRVGGSAQPPILANMHTLVMDNCTAGGPGTDNGIDAEGLYSVVAAVSGNTVTVFANPPVGTVMSFYDPYTFAPQGQAVVQSSSPITDTNQCAALAAAVNSYQQTIGGGSTPLAANTQFWVLTLDRTPPATPFSGFDTDTLSPNITITNSYFADMNAQALLVKGHNVTISGNRIDRSSGTAIHAQLSRFWREGPVPQNYTISNNIINNNPFGYNAPPGATGIWGWAISALGVEVEGSLTGVGAIDNITITGNQINNTPCIPILIKNAQDVQISNNTIVAPMPQIPIYQALMAFGYGILPNSAIVIATSRGVTLSANTLTSPTPYCPNLVQLGPDDEVGSVMGQGATEGWNVSSINCRFPGSTATYSGEGDVWTLNSNGWDVGSTADQVLFVGGAAQGNHTLQAEVTSISSDTDGWGKEGVMFRESTSSGAAMADIMATPANGVQFNWRASTGAQAANATASGVPNPTPANPVWVRLQNVGTSFTAFYSLDGVNWTQVGTAQSITFSGAQYLAGLAGCSHNGASTPNSATFTNVGYADGWNAETCTMADIDNRGLSGLGNYNFSTGTWTVMGGGWQISAADDQMTYASGSTTGNKTFITELTGMTNSSAYAQAGVMFRDTLNNNASMACICATPGTNVNFMTRSTTGASLVDVQSGSVPAPTAANPVWLKLTNVGSTISGYYSLDGVNWTQVGTPQAITFSNTNYLAGFASTCHCDSLNTGVMDSATFANISLQ